MKQVSKLVHPYDEIECAHLALVCTSLATQADKCLMHAHMHIHAPYTQTHTLFSVLCMQTPAAPIDSLV